ncbi:hypothetical protein J6TS1_00070 [Siminovitchia terrae]|uniref:Uncharacterized protein n=1 Tax=Siminovitchia terrae TaxID=1914933 RepID=A0ABQ4KR26_SIMTE|nr:hypothetical protein J22TS1_14030 [Siminovitchia terrae]GIN94137.1 hypothetical protein J6TS1_00070 [Siminovitchia terrae]
MEGYRVFSKGDRGTCIEKDYVFGITEKRDTVEICKHKRKKKKLKTEKFRHKLVPLLKKNSSGFFPKRSDFH